MTGVMDRMAQRARGTLVAAEPRIAVSTLPMQTPSPTAAAEWTGEVNVRVEQASNAIEGRDTASPANTRRDASRPTEDGLLKQYSAPNGRALASSPLEKVPQLLQHDAADREPAPVPHIADREPVVTGPASAESIGSASLSPAEAEASSLNRTLPEQNERPADIVVLRPVTATLVAADEGEPASLNLEDDGLTQIVHEHREISISIGTVTLQSAPKPAPHRAHMFRPRVSLDAFLERRQGSR